MSYRDYVLAAYAVFVVVLLWDFVVTRVRTAQLLRATKRLAARRAAASPQAAGVQGARELRR
ncbi:MAG: heme exporter protein CcmD [Luteimonas sp.]